MTTFKIILTVILTIIGLSFLIWLITFFMVRFGGLNLPCPNPEVKLRSKVSASPTPDDSGTRYFKTSFDSTGQPGEQKEITFEAYTAYLKKFPGGEEKTMICNFNLNQQA